MPTITKEKRRKSFRFYDALPKHKAELIDGKLILGGSLSKSAMALGYMVENLGAAYVAELVPKDLLTNAVADYFGRKKRPKKLADFKPVQPGYYPPTKLASDLRMGLFMEDIRVWGGTMAIKLGEDVFMPDVYILKAESADRLREYYFEGVPDLVIEVSHPFMRAFDFGTRLERYARAGLPEAWMVDYEKRSFHPLFLQNGSYVEAPVQGDIYWAKTIEGFGIEHGKIFDSDEKWGMEPLSIFKIPDSLRDRGKLRFREDEEEEAPFAPRLALGPVPITFHEFI